MVFILKQALNLVHTAYNLLALYGAMNLPVAVSAQELSEARMFSSPCLSGLLRRLTMGLST